MSISLAIKRHRLNVPVDSSKALPHRGFEAIGNTKDFDLRSMEGESVQRVRLGS
jgi:hypothetical protein